MFSISIETVLIGGLALSGAVGVVILSSLLYNARLWLRDYPAEMQARVAPLTKTEKRQRAVTGVLLIAAFAAPVLWALSRLEAASGGSLPFLTLYLHAFLILNIGNLFDALVIDFLIIAVMQPKFVRLAGAEGLEYLFRDWNKHISAYLKGIIFCAVFALPVALVAAAI